MLTYADACRRARIFPTRQQLLEEIDAMKLRLHLTSAHYSVEAALKSIKHDKHDVHKVLKLLRTELDAVVC